MVHPARNGGDLVLDVLWALGSRAVVGLPGQHALGLFDALRRSPIELLSARVENNAGFMADGMARVSSTFAPLLLSTGPGALTALPALHESRASSIPVLAISAQIPSVGLGGGRHGYLHELPEQSAAFTQVAKGVFTVRSVEQIPSAITHAAARASSAPTGPVLVEIPQDLLLAPVGDLATSDVTLERRTLRPDRTAIERAADLLSNAARPVVLAGGGVSRSGAQPELIALAERLDVPVFTTFGGKDAFPLDHRLAAGSYLEDVAVTDYLEAADVVLVVGSGLGELSTNYHTFEPSGRLIQIEADLHLLGANYRCLGIHADAKPALAELADRVRAQPRRTDPAAGLAELASTIEQRLLGQGLDAELQLLRELRSAVPPDTDTFWDMTILAYWAWSAWDSRHGLFASAQGAGGLGYALPAALGAAFAHRVRGTSRPVLAVSGDGGALYGISELAAAVQEQLDVTWLIVDDGGYGVLREYMTDAFGQTTATELVRPDYVRLAEAFGARAVEADLDTVAAAVAEQLHAPGPSVVALPARLRMFAPTHRAERAPAWQRQPVAHGQQPRAIDLPR